jgi:hypothetical protein
MLVKCHTTDSRYLYDCPLDSQLTQVFDSQRRLLYTGDAVPDEVALSKGEHTARVMLCHDSLAVLEQLKSTCLVGVGWRVGDGAGCVGGCGV